MDTLDRRSLLGGVALAGAGLAATGAAAASRDLKLADIRKEADVACLYHCDFGEPAACNTKLTPPRTVGWSVAADS